jgi:hypothetical protein
MQGDGKKYVQNIWSQNLNISQTLAEIGGFQKNRFEDNAHILSYVLDRLQTYRIYILCSTSKESVLLFLGAGGIRSIAVSIETINAINKKNLTKIFTYVFEKKK